MSFHHFKPVSFLSVKVALSSSGIVLKIFKNLFGKVLNYSSQSDFISIYREIKETILTLRRFCLIIALKDEEF